MPGRKRKPPALRALTGGKVAPDAPEVARLRDLDPPAFLSDQAAQHWPDLAGLLSDMGIAANSDRIALALLCEALAEWIEAGQTIAKYGATYQAVTEAGAVMHRAHPAVAQRADSARRVQSLLAEFGMTPAARSKVSGLPDLPGDDPAQKYFT
ncbi:phage terminase small subunit P27 family [Lacimonas salitolerans]|uniref:Phage terminase small subunit P27 family n=1 Tax=Lacimonas salitolerans TaxID=1323750 RepID=A0ABW4E9G2_9RHOB